MEKPTFCIQNLESKAIKFFSHPQWQKFMILMFIWIKSTIHDLHLLCKYMFTIYFTIWWHWLPWYKLNAKQLHSAAEVFTILAWFYVNLVFIRFLYCYHPQRFLLAVNKCQNRTMFSVPPLMTLTDLVYCTSIPSLIPLRPLKSGPMTTEMTCLVMATWIMAEYSLTHGIVILS